jgi:hypothetical protein
MEKEAFVFRLADKALRAGMSLAARRPLATAGTVAGVGLGGVSAIGSYRQNKSGFDPEVQKARLGDIPVPPGVS